MKMLLAGALVAFSAFGQSGPPTYDYDAATPGTQGPTSPLLSGYTYRSVRTYQVAIPILVSAQELQAALPPGYIPIATPAGSETATMTLTFFFDQRFQPTVGSDTLGPVTALLATTNVTNTTLPTPRTEIVFPIFETSGWAKELNESFGPGAARNAVVKGSMEQSDGQTKFKFKIRDREIGMAIDVEAEGSMDINTRAVSDPVGFAFRALDGWTPLKPFRAASQSDTLSVPMTSGRVKISTPGQRLNMRTGSLQILGLGANATISRGVEFVIKFE